MKNTTSRGGRGPTMVLDNKFRLPASPLVESLRGKKWVYAPLKISMIYLFGTFALFMMGPLADQVKDTGMLVGYVIMYHFAFAVGYIIKVQRVKQIKIERKSLKPSRVRLIVFISATWFLLYGVLSLQFFGATSLSGIIERTLDPLNAYADKFSTLRTEVLAESNSLIRILNFIALFYALLIPVLISYLKYIPWYLRVYALMGVTAFALSYTYIGTNKGLGDIFIMAISGYVCLRLVRSTGSRGVRFFTSKAALFLTSALVIFTVAASYIFGARTIKNGENIDVYGITNGFLINLLGETGARGLAVIIQYPSHGYLGMSKNFDTPFVWDPWGGFPAIGSLKFQYFGGSNPELTTYPYLTEQLTGYSSTKVWSTAYPWFASTFTFTGVILFMAVLGYFFAALWIEVRRSGSILAIGMLSLMFMLVLYLPSNNQVFMIRLSTFAFFTMFFLYYGRKFLMTLQGRVDP